MLKFNVYPAGGPGTAAELKKFIAILRNPEFDSKDIDPDLHKQMAKAVEDGCIKCFNLLEGLKITQRMLTTEVKTRVCNRQCCYLSKYTWCILFEMIEHFE